MAITESSDQTDAAATRMIDGRPLVPQQVTMRFPEMFETVEQERAHRKAKLAGALRIFGKFGFSEGVAGHITARDPEFPELFWVNPFGMNFLHIRSSDLILVDHAGNVVYGTQAVNTAAFVIHAAIHARPTWSPPPRPLPTASRSARSVSRWHRSPRTPAPSTRIMSSSASRAGRWRSTSAPARRSPSTSPPARRRSTRTTAVHRRRDRRRRGVVVHHDGAQLPGAADGDGRWRAELIRHEYAAYTQEQTGYPLAGWFQFQPLWDQICRTDPELFD